MPDFDAGDNRHLEVSDGIGVTQDAADTGWGKISRNSIAILDILKRVKAGETQTAIAKIHGITQSAVSKVLDKYTPRDELAVLRAKALAPTMIESLKRSAINGEAQGRHGAATAVLQAAKVIGSGDGYGGPAVNVQIGVNVDKDCVIHPYPQGNVISNYQTQTLGESQSMQPLTAPYSGAIEAKVVGESEI